MLQLKARQVPDAAAVADRSSGATVPRPVPQSAEAKALVTSTPAGSWRAWLGNNSASKSEQRRVMHIGRGRRHRVDQLALAIYTKIELHPEVRLPLPDRASWSGSWSNSRCPQNLQQRRRAHC